jgi:hypothetical protein
MKQLKNKLNSGYNTYLSVYRRVPSYVLHTVSRPDQNKSRFNYNGCSMYSCNCTGLQLRLGLRWDHNLRYLYVSACSSWLITAFPPSTVTWQAFWHSMQNCKCFLFMCIASSVYHQIRKTLCIYTITHPSPNSCISVVLKTRVPTTNFPRPLFPYSFFHCLKVVRPEMTGRNCVSMHHSLLVMTVSALRKYGEIPINLNNRHGVPSIACVVLGSQQISNCISFLPSISIHLRGLIKFLQQKEICHILYYAFL